MRTQHNYLGFTSPPLLLDLLLSLFMPHIPFLEYDIGNAPYLHLIQPYLYYYPSDWNASPEQDDLFFSVPSSGNTGETWDTVHTEGKSSRHPRDKSNHAYPK
jgi:hypothetical protein